MIVLILSGSCSLQPPEAVLNPQISPEDPVFRDAVIAVVDVRVHEVLDRIGTQLDRAGYTEAAQFVRANFGG